MSVDLATVKRVAHLARIAVTDEEAARMEGELNTILGFVEQLSEVDVDGVEPMTSVMPMAMKKREDVVTDGSKAEDIVANAPEHHRQFLCRPEGGRVAQWLFRSPLNPRFRMTSQGLSRRWMPIWCLWRRSNFISA